MRLSDRLKVAAAAESSEGQRSEGAQHCRAANHSDSRTASQLCQSSWMSQLSNLQSFHAPSDSDVPERDAIGNTEAVRQALDARINVVLVLDPPFWGFDPPPPQTHTHMQATLLFSSTRAANCILASCVLCTRTHQVLPALYLMMTMQAV